MKIVDKSNNESLFFESLGLGDVFKFDDRIFMKVSNNGDGENNAYDFRKGRLTEISEDTLVQYVPSELVLHERRELDDVTVATIPEEYFVGCPTCDFGFIRPTRDEAVKKWNRRK